DLSVISHGFFVYQVIMLAVDFSEISLLKMGTSFCVFSNRIALKMCVTILFMLRRISNLFLRSSWYSRLYTAILLELMKSSTIFTICIRRNSLFPGQFG